MVSTWHDLYFVCIKRIQMKRLSTTNESVEQYLKDISIRVSFMLPFEETAELPHTYLVFMSSSKFNFLNFFPSNLSYRFIKKKS